MTERLRPLYRRIGLSTLAAYRDTLLRVKIAAAEHSLVVMSSHGSTA